LIENRELFNSKIAVHSFCGYAFNQLKKMGTANETTGQMGEKRKALRAKFGYDTKYAYHTIRLAHMLLEFIRSDGREMNVYRKGIDSDLLLEIRDGKFSKDAIVSVAEDKLNQARVLVETSKLPEKPDKEGIRILCKTILREHLRT
jgi:hypothetical protein